MGRVVDQAVNGLGRLAEDDKYVSGRKGGQILKVRVSVKFGMSASTTYTPVLPCATY